MKKCDCENFKKLIIDTCSLGQVQDWNFCTFCSEKMKEETDECQKLNEHRDATHCPKEIEHGHCDECLRRKLKACEYCGSKNDVRLRHDFEAKYDKGWHCLCYDCRMTLATSDSLRRSW